MIRYMIEIFFVFSLIVDSVIVSFKLKINLKRKAVETYFVGLTIKD